MATKRELVYDLRNIVRGGKVSDDELVSYRQVAFWVDNTRNTLIRRDLDKRRTINPDLVQSLGCVPVERIDASECPCKIVGCTILRTTNQVPKSVELKYKNLITRVGPVKTTGYAYNFVPYERAIWNGGNKFTASIPMAFLHNGYIYVAGGPSYFQATKFINIQGVFEDPQEASEFTTCAGDPCYTDDSEYPIAAWMIEEMKKEILTIDFRVAAVAPTDVTGDSKGDPEQQRTQ